MSKRDWYTLMIAGILIVDSRSTSFSRITTIMRACASSLRLPEWHWIARVPGSARIDHAIAILPSSRPRALLSSSDRHFGLIARYMPRLATLRLTSRLASRNVGPASQFYTRFLLSCTRSSRTSSDIHIYAFSRGSAKGEPGYRVGTRV